MSASPRCCAPAMNDAAKKRLVLVGLSVGCLALAGAFLLDLWGRPVSLEPILPVDPIFTNTATVSGGGDGTATATDPTVIDPDPSHHKPSHHKPGHHESHGKK